MGAEEARSLRWSLPYRERLAEVYSQLIPPGSRVLELGCGWGDLLSALKPSFGVGVDFSSEMVRVARSRHPELTFLECDVHELKLEETFDFVILSDLVNDLWDIQRVLDQVASVCTSRTRVILNCYSRAWQLPLAAVRALGLARPVLLQNWVTTEDVANLLDLADFEVLRSFSEVLLPLRVPGLNQLCNRYLVKVWPFRMAALTNFIVARPKPRPEQRRTQPTVSVIVPARNEEGNVPAIFRRIPEMGAGTEVVFVEGGSADGTWQAAEREIAARPGKPYQLLKQQGKGKGDAVRLAFSHATGDILMILDADLSVAPEDLPRFLEALRSGKGDFINGVRLVYPMEKRAMRFLNLLGNKFFSMAFSWLLGQEIKDTLCGTKVLWREDYERIAANRSYFGEFDPFGDYDLIFGAARLNLKIVDMPIRYRERTYGEPQISRFRDGALLLRMVAFAARRLKFV